MQQQITRIISLLIRLGMYCVSVNVLYSNFEGDSVYKTTFIQICVVLSSKQKVINKK